MIRRAGPKNQPMRQIRFLIRSRSWSEEPAKTGLAAWLNAKKPLSLRKERGY